MMVKATKEQISQICANAVNASKVVGIGAFLFQERHEFKWDDFEKVDHGVYLDYIEGRMVKLDIINIDENIWEFRNFKREPNIEYQSWAIKYPTFKDLVLSVLGVEILE